MPQRKFTRAGAKQWGWCLSLYRRRLLKRALEAFAQSSKAQGLGRVGRGGNAIWGRKLFAGSLLHLTSAKFILLFIFLAWHASAFDAKAGELIYTPVNPSFGGSPLNSSHLMGLANAQNQHKSKQDTPGFGPSDAFVQMLQSRLYSSLADAVSNAIFGPNAQQSGTVKFQDQQVAFINTGTEIKLTITNFLTGKVTEITVPTLVN
jgi:curli production assembly/transport component CsgF